MQPKYYPTYFKSIFFSHPWKIQSCATNTVFEDIVGLNNFLTMIWDSAITHRNSTAWNEPWILVILSPCGNILFLVLISLMHHIVRYMLWIGQSMLLPLISKTTVTIHLIHLNHVHFVGVLGTNSLLVQNCRIQPRWKRHTYVCTLLFSIFFMPLRKLVVMHPFLYFYYWCACNQMYLNLQQPLSSVSASLVGQYVSSILFKVR